MSLQTQSKRVVHLSEIFQQLVLNPVVQPPEEHEVSLSRGDCKINKDFSLDLHILDAEVEEARAVEYHRRLEDGCHAKLILTSMGRPICKVLVYNDRFVFSIEPFHDVSVYEKGTRGHNEALIVLAIMDLVTKFDK